MTLCNYWRKLWAFTTEFRRKEEKHEVLLSVIVWLREANLDLLSKNTKIGVRVSNHIHQHACHFLELKKYFLAALWTEFWFSGRALQLRSWRFLARWNDQRSPSRGEGRLTATSGPWWTAQLGTASWSDGARGPRAVRRRSLCLDSVGWSWGGPIGNGARDRGDWRAYWGTSPTCPAAEKEKNKRTQLISKEIWS